MSFIIRQMDVTHKVLLIHDQVKVLTLEGNNYCIYTYMKNKYVKDNLDHVKKCGLRLCYQNLLPGQWLVLLSLVDIIHPITDGK